MKFKQNSEWNSWKDVKKDLTWNNIKIIICSAVFPTIILYGWTFWAKVVNPLMLKYQAPKTQEEAILSLCVIAGFVAPVFFAIPASSFGLWIGKVLRVYQVDNSTRRVWWEGKTYFVRDMPQEERDKITELVSQYRRLT